MLADSDIPLEIEGLAFEDATDRQMPTHRFVEQVRNLIDSSTISESGALQGPRGSLRDQSAWFAFAVDIVLVIDATGSMAAFLDTAKRSARRLYQNIDLSLRSIGKSVDEIRVRIVVFRDFYQRNPGSASIIEETAFFDLPSEIKRFARSVGRIKSTSPDMDGRANGLEALAK